MEGWVAIGGAANAIAPDRRAPRLLRVPARPARGEEGLGGRCGWPPSGESDLRLEERAEKSIFYNTGNVFLGRSEMGFRGKGPLRSGPPGELVRRPRLRPPGV